METRFDLISSASKQSLRRNYQPELHKCFSLQLLAVCAEILRSRFTPLLIYALYPVLHSLVQPLIYVNGSAFASLQHITRSLGFASPGNLLLANFDYALRRRAIEGCDDPLADWMLDLRLHYFVERSKIVHCRFTHSGASVQS